MLSGSSYKRKSLFPSLLVSMSISYISIRNLWIYIGIQDFCLT